MNDISQTNHSHKIIVRQLYRNQKWDELIPEALCVVLISLAVIGAISAFVGTIVTLAEGSSPLLFAAIGVLSITAGVVSGLSLESLVSKHSDKYYDRDPNRWVSYKYEKVEVTEHDIKLIQQKKVEELNSEDINKIINKIARSNERILTDEQMDELLSQNRGAINKAMKDCNQALNNIDAVIEHMFEAKKEILQK